MEFDQLLAYLFRWIHMFAGVAWIGLLYYFNFVQTEYFKEAEAPAKRQRSTNWYLVPFSGSGTEHCLLFSPGWLWPDIWAVL